MLTSTLGIPWFAAVILTLLKGDGPGLGGWQLPG